MNPLLMESKNKFKTIEFNNIKLEHFMPAIHEAISIAKVNIANIKSSNDKPTFKNTIVALEISQEDLDRAVSVYFHLFSSESTPEFQALASEISPILANFGNDITLDKELFERVESVYNKDYDNLDFEDKRLTEITYKSFTRNGANLDEKSKIQLRKVDEELSSSSSKFLILLVISGIGTIAIIIMGVRSRLKKAFS